MRERFTDITALPVPPLMKIYLRYGIKIISFPAIVWEFKTIDHRVLMNKDRLGRGTTKMFMSK